MFENVECLFEYFIKRWSAAFSYLFLLPIALNTIQFLHGSIYVTKSQKAPIIFEIVGARLL